MVKGLIECIKRISPEIEIILAVNADYKEKFDEDYRKGICQLCVDNSNVFPVFFPTFTSLSKMWNMIVLNASNEFVLLMNDDLIVENKSFIETVNEEVEKRKNRKIQDQIFKINDSFSYFVCSKAFLDDIGYFDERLLAFGEEDGDLVWRYIEKYGDEIQSILIEGVSNMGEGYLIANPNMKTENVKNYRLVPQFNRDFIDTKYKKSFRGIKGMFESKRKRIKADEKQYPYESFKRNFYKDL